MIDITLLRRDLDGVIAQLQRRKTPQPFLDVERFSALEAERKQIQSATEQLQARRNALSKQIGQAKGKGEDSSALMAEVTGIGDQQKAGAERLELIQAELHSDADEPAQPAARQCARRRRRGGQRRGPALGPAARLRLHAQGPCRPRRPARARLRDRRQALGCALHLPARPGGAAAPRAGAVHAGPADQRARLHRVLHPVHRQPRGARGHRAAAQVQGRHVLGLARR